MWAPLRPGVETISENHWQRLICRARLNFSNFHNRRYVDVTDDEIANSSAGIYGWAESDQGSHRSYPGIDRNSAAVKKCQEYLELVRSQREMIYC